MKAKRKKILLLSTAGAILALWLAWGNYSLEVNEYTVSDSRIPEAFSGFRIAQVSDLHNASLGRDNTRLLDALRKAEPDIIVVTGDLVDSRRPDMKVAEAFVKAAGKIAPVYYVSGNHEARLDYTAIRDMLLKADVIVLDDEKTTLQRNGEAIMLVGLADPRFSSEKTLEMTLHRLMEDVSEYSILLSHRPELFEMYKDAGVCLSFTGHAHGGQVRLPFVGGVLVPNQGFFPEYDSGMYKLDESIMLVSRGLGDSIIPLRINNRRSLLIVELRPGE